MSGPNVFAVARSVWDDPDFENEPFSEREAWMWLVSSAAWREKRCRGANGGPVALKRGEFSFSIRFLAEKWQWSKSSIDRFLNKLETRDMLRDTSRDSVKVYSIKNYNRFQVVGIPKRDTIQDTNRETSGTEAGHERDKEEAGETVKQLNTSSLRSEGTASRRSAPSKPIKAKFEIPSWVPPEPWAAFVEMRRAGKSPFTEQAMRLAVADLEKLRDAGCDPGAVLNQSVMRAWRGLFAVKTEGSTDGQRFRNPKGPTAQDKLTAGALDAISRMGGGPSLPDADEGGNSGGGEHWRSEADAGSVAGPGKASDTDADNHPHAGTGRILSAAGAFRGGGEPEISGVLRGSRPPSRIGDCQSLQSIPDEFGKQVFPDTGSNSRSLQRPCIGDERAA